VTGPAGPPGHPDPLAAAALVVDARGRRCPVPVIELAKAIGRVADGELVAVLSDDAAARLDIPAWCQLRGHEYAGERPAETGSAYLVRRLKTQTRAAEPAEPAPGGTGTPGG
jgi:cysteine desulfurase